VTPAGLALAFVLVLLAMAWMSWRDAGKKHASDMAWRAAMERAIDMTIREELGRAREELAACALAAKPPLSPAPVLPDAPSMRAFRDLQDEVEAQGALLAAHTAALARLTATGEERAILEELHEAQRETDPAEPYDQDDEETHRGVPQISDERPSEPTQVMKRDNEALLRGVRMRSVPPASTPRPRPVPVQRARSTIVPPPESRR
jgi:hypothetical protein